MGCVTDPLIHVTVCKCLFLWVCFLSFIDSSLQLPAGPSRCHTFPGLVGAWWVGSTTRSRTCGRLKLGGEPGSGEGPRMPGGDSVGRRRNRTRDNRFTPLESVMRCGLFLGCLLYLCVLVVFFKLTSWISVRWICLFSFGGSFHLLNYVVS